MKKIFLLTILLLSSLSQAADFTISINPNSKKVKGDNVVIGDLFLSSTLLYASINGKNWGIAGSPANINSAGKGDYIAQGPSCYFMSSDCSGNCLVNPSGGVPSMIPNAVFIWGGSARDHLLVVSEQITISDGNLSVNSCKNPWDAPSSCTTNMNSCSGSSQILQGNLVRPGVSFRNATIENRNSYPLKPSHDFRFSIISIE